MKFSYFLILLFHITVISTTAQITFEKTYGGTSSDVALSVQQTSDRGYIIGGSTQSYGAGSWDVYLIKTDSSGSTIWTKTYGDSNDDQGYAVRYTSDGGYIIAGTTKPFGAGPRNVYLIKTDSSGDTLWTKTFSGKNDDQCYTVQQTTDGGYIIAGSSWSSGTSYDAYLIKTNSLGDTLWTKTYGGSSRDVAYAVLQTTEGGYILTGYSWSFGDSAYTVYLIKTDSVGNSQWMKTCGGIRYTLGMSIEMTSDTGFIIAGTIDSQGTGNQHVYLIKTDSLGDTLWTKIYNGKSVDIGFVIKQTTDEGYIIAGNTRLFGASSNVYLIKTNSLGDTLWTKTYGGNDNDVGMSAQQTSDGGYIIGGYTFSFGAGSSDVYLIKTDERGIVTSVRGDDNYLIPSVYSLSQNFPNPFNPTMTIRYELPKTSHVTLKVFDILGQEIAILVNEVQEAGSNSVKWIAPRVSSGVYFCRLTADAFSQTKKIVLLR